MPGVDRYWVMLSLFAYAGLCWPVLRVLSCVEFYWRVLSDIGFYIDNFDHNGAQSVWTSALARVNPTGSEKKWISSAFDPFGAEKKILSGSNTRKSFHVRNFLARRLFHSEVNIGLQYLFSMIFME